MKKAISTLGLIAVFIATVGLSTIAENKTMTWTGWISDDHCGAKGMSAQHKSCAQTCIKNGSKYVFVNSADKKVITIHNQDAVNGDNDLGKEVKVTGHLLDDGSLQIDKVGS